MQFTDAGAHLIDEVRDAARVVPSLARNAWLAQHILPNEPNLRAWLQRYRISGLETDDIIQETYAVLATLAQVDHIDSPQAYAFQTAKSLVMRHFRRARIVRFEAIGDTELLSAATDEPSPEQQVSAREDLRRVSELIAGLPAKCREAFSLRNVHGRSQREVAAQMGISESTVEKHVGRALRILMSRMKTAGIDVARAAPATDSRDSSSYVEPLAQPVY